MHSLTWYEKYTCCHFFTSSTLWIQKLHSNKRRNKHSTHICLRLVCFSFAFYADVIFILIIFLMRYSLSTRCKYVFMLVLNSIVTHARKRTSIASYDIHLCTEYMIWAVLSQVNVDSRRTESNERKVDAAWEWNDSNNKLFFYYLIDCILLISFSHSIDFWTIEYWFCFECDPFYFENVQFVCVAYSNFRSIR